MKGETKRMKYEIEKDPYLNKYIVWEVHQNYKVQVFCHKLKKECTKWLKNIDISK